jgi:hypothetical protein
MTQRSERSIPEPSALSRPFWEAAAHRRLVRPHCSDCGSDFFPPQIACPACLSENWAWLQSTGRGVIYSFTVCHRAPEPGFEAPYVIAIVDLEEGWSMLTNIVGPEPPSACIGLHVHVDWLPARGGMLLPGFTAEKG